MYIWLQLVTALVAARLLFLVYRTLASPLRSVPGPFAARFSRAWYWYRVWRGHFERDNIRLHEQYGSSVVRVAPNWYSCTSPESIKKIYAPGSKFTKSDWYNGWAHPDPDQWTLFPDKNMKRHGMKMLYTNTRYTANNCSGDEKTVCGNVLTQLAHQL